MPRLASLAKAGYYPTPPRVAEWIANHLRASEGGERLLDPCAGEGTAAALIANRLHLESYGIELDRDRAVASSLVLTSVLHSDFQQVSITPDSFGLLYLNPPYDTDAETKRLEYKFLTHTAKWLMPEGVLVYIVPRHVINVQTAVYLVSHLRDIRVFQFPQPEYEQFKQIVLFGVKSEELLSDNQKEAAELVAQCRTTLPILPEACETPYHIPPVNPNTRFYFHSKVITPEEVLTEAFRRGVWSKAEWRDLFQPLDQDLQFKPLMPLRLGHLAMLIAAGLLKNMELRKEGKRLLVKGRTTRARIVSRDEENQAEITRFTPVPEIVTLDLESGQLERLDEPQALSAFMEEWQQVIAEKVLQNFTPLYQFNYEELDPVVAETLRKLSPHRRLAGRAETGLFETQKHVAVALWQRMLKESFALLLGEPGVGKTTIACAVAALLGEKANPTIVICPPHLVEKWKREIADVISNSHVAALYRLSDVRRFVSDFKRLPNGTMAFAVVSKEMAKAGSGFAPAYQMRRRLVNVKGDGSQHAPAKAALEQWLKQVQSLVRSDTDDDATVRPSTESDDENETTFDQTVEIEGLGPAEDTSWAEQFNDESLWDALYKFEREARELAEAAKLLLRDVVEYFVCPQCGNPLRAVSRGQTVGFVRDADYFEDKKRRCSECQSPLYQSVHLNKKGALSAIDVASLKTTRYPIADFIKRKHKGFFKLLIGDECHQFKGQSSDQGYAFQALVYACERTLAMTGSIYGGRASSVFYLLHRLSSSIRDKYGWSEVQRWIEKYGVLEEIVKDKKDSDDVRVGVFSGKRRSETIVREGAGISPELVTRMLEYTAFVQLSDLGFALPNFTEIPHYLNLAPDHREAYDRLQHALKMYLSDNRFNGKSQRVLGAYLQSLLGYPNAGFRAEVVRDPDGVVIASAPALGEDRLYPKEERLIQLVREARVRGRRVLVYCRQTSTRDITARLKKLLEGAGVRAVVLTSQVNARAREAWVQQQLNKGCQVLITNMQLVETGLDLVDFATLIFVEPHYSVVRRTTA
jgi:superfamily II DNA or RNA helicase/16S rRNA G966 N2-methylase RsmD